MLESKSPQKKDGTRNGETTDQYKHLGAGESCFLEIRQHYSLHKMFTDRSSSLKIRYSDFNKRFRQEVNDTV